VRREGSIEGSERREERVTEVEEGGEGTGTFRVVESAPMENGSLLRSVAREERGKEEEEGTGRGG